jgi:hypothetical protein
VLISKPLAPLLQRTGRFIARVSLLQLHRQNVDGSFELVKLGRQLERIDGRR